MNKAALITTGKKLNGSDLYLLSVFDLEPSGVIVHAYNQGDSREYMLPITEMELAKAGITRHPSSLMAFLETIFLDQLGTQVVLASSNEKISRIKKRPTGEELDAVLRAPIVDGGESIHDLLVRGLVDLCKVKPVGLDSVQWLGEWLLSNNPNKPRVDIPDDD